MNGKTIKTGKIANGKDDFIVEVGTLSKGVHCIRICTDSQIIGTNYFIKN